MKPGRQWLFFDADFFDNSITLALLERFGPAGPLLFVAFLCACKRNQPQGQIRYRNEFEALELFGLETMALTDRDDLPFTLHEFFTFTGRYKQTSRKTRGHTHYITATGWADWQDSRNAAQAYERDRKRRWRAEHQDNDKSRKSPERVPKESHFSPETHRQNRRSERHSVPDNVPPDTDTDTDIKGMSRKTRGAKPPEPPNYKTWEPDAETPDEPLVDLKSALTELPWRKST